MVLEWINRLSVWWWEHVLHASWQAAVVGGVVLLLVHSAGRRWPAPLRYALLVLALLKFAYPPLLPLPTGVFSHFVTTKAILPEAHERKPPPTADLRATVATRELEVGGPGLGRARGMPWVGCLMLVHGAGVLVILLRVLTQASGLRVLARSSKASLQDGLREDYRDLAIELGVYRIPPLTISEAVPAPMAFGIKRPAIMLPAKIARDLSAEELKAVLAHELAHCQRGDPWVNSLQLLLVALWWFHPVAWLLHRSLKDVREDCCDDLLLARGLVSNDTYCDVLLRAAKELLPVAPLSAALGLGQKTHPLGRRLARITDWTLQRSERVSFAGSIAVVLAAGLLLPGVRTTERIAGAAETKAADPSRRLLATGPGTRSLASSAVLTPTAAPLRPKDDKLASSRQSGTLSSIPAYDQPRAQLAKFQAQQTATPSAPFSTALRTKSESRRGADASGLRSARPGEPISPGLRRSPVPPMTPLAGPVKEGGPMPAPSRFVPWVVPQPLNRSLVQVFPSAGPRGGVRVVTVHYYVPGPSIFWWRTPT